MQVTRRPERVVPALLLPVLAYLLLLRLYGRTLDPEQDASLYALKQRFAEEVAQANFLNPNSSLQSTAFGRITAARDPRIMQIAAKLYF